ncbi:hypothetical protein [Fimbriiglobus ruber]|nr:hypothetical protein [Fimbriiglobus ruber]
MTTETLPAAREARCCRPVSPLATVRMCLVAWMQEVFPEATSASAIVTWRTGGYTAVDVGPVPVRLRWPGFPRAVEARDRLRAAVRAAIPDCATIDVVFYVDDRRSGILPIPL